MSVMNYIAFPRRVNSYYESYVKYDGEDDFMNNTNPNERKSPFSPVIEGQTDGYISFTDIGDKTFFTDCFKNQYIYIYSIFHPKYHYEKKMEIIDRYIAKEKFTRVKSNRKAMNKELYPYWNMEWQIKNQIFYKYLYENLHDGEFAEIYKSWIEEGGENGIYFSAPTHDVTITLKDLLKRRFVIYNLDYDERKKMTIYKTG